VGRHVPVLKVVQRGEEAAEAHWRAVNAPHLVALVRAGAVFEKGKLIERPVDSSTTTEAA